jgi:hypothetical protein
MIVLEAWEGNCRTSQDSESIVITTITESDAPAWADLERVDLSLVNIENDRHGKQNPGSETKVMNDTVENDR